MHCAGAAGHPAHGSPRLAAERASGSPNRRLARRATIAMMLDHQLGAPASAAGVVSTSPQLPLPAQLSRLNLAMRGGTEGGSAGALEAVHSGSGPHGPHSGSGLEVAASPSSTEPSGIRRKFIKIISLQRPLKPRTGSVTASSAPKFGSQVGCQLGRSGG
jgi:hypothetical protein